MTQLVIRVMVLIRCGDRQQETSGHIPSNKKPTLPLRLRRFPTVTYVHLSCLRASGYTVSTTEGAVADTITVCSTLQSGSSYGQISRSKNIPCQQCRVQEQYTAQWGNFELGFSAGQYQSKRIPCPTWTHIGHRRYSAPYNTSPVGSSNWSVKTLGSQTRIAMAKVDSTRRLVSPANRS